MMLLCWSSLVVLVVVVALVPPAAVVASAASVDEAAVPLQLRAAGGGQGQREGGKRRMINPSSALLFLQRGGGGGGGGWPSPRPVPRRTNNNRYGPPSGFSSQQQQQRQQRQSSSTTTTTIVDNDKNTNKNREVEEMIDAFLTRDSRNSFIARVYAILAGQLVVTAISVAIFGLNPDLSMWMRRGGTFGPFVPVLSLLVSTAAWYVMLTSTKARQTSPLKWKMLSLFTAAEAIVVGFISSFYTFTSVVSAMMVTSASAAAISLYTANQKNPNYDLSQWGAGLSSCGLIFVAFGILHLLQITGVLPAGFLPYNDMIYCAAGAGLFSFYLAYHTKLIVAGKHSKYRMNEKDYVLGAMTLYSDIISMFIYILRMLGEDRD